MTLNSFSTNNLNHRSLLNLVPQSRTKRTLILKNHKKTSTLKVSKWTPSFRVPIIIILLKKKSLWAFSTKITTKNSSKKLSSYRIPLRKANNIQLSKSTRTKKKKISLKLRKEKNIKKYWRRMILRKTVSGSEQILCLSPRKEKKRTKKW